MEDTVMHGHNSVGRLVSLVLALLVAVGIGVTAYQAGVAHGLALQIPAGAAAAPLAYPYYGWYRPWGFGLFGPFLFLLLWFGLARMLWWGGRRRWYCTHDGPWGYDEWHRRAHDRMRGESSSPTNL
jgi:hypothetical protein